MYRLLSISFFIASVLGANVCAQTFGLPIWLDLDSWAINNSPCGQAVHSTEARDAFKSSLQNNIKAKFPTISSSALSNDNGAATKESFLSSLKNSYEILFLSLHGKYVTTYQGQVWNDQFLGFQNGTNCDDLWESAYPTYGFGGRYTKWVFVNSCQYLYRQYASAYIPRFQGAHAIFGFQSNALDWSGKSDWWQCTWYGCDYTHSWDTYTYFWNNWFSGQTMWDAFYSANISNFNHRNKSYFHADPNSGWTFGMVEAFGSALNNQGQWINIEGGRETVTNVFREQMPMNNTSTWKIGGLIYQTAVVGTPQY